MALYYNGEKISCSLIIDGNITTNKYNDIWDGTSIPDVYIDRGTGAVVGYGGWSATDFIDIKDYSEIYRIGGITGADWNAFYDENKSYIGWTAGASVDIPPSGARYVRYSGAGTLTGHVIAQVNYVPIGDGNNKIYPVNSPLPYNFLYNENDINNIALALGKNVKVSEMAAAVSEIGVPGTHYTIHSDTYTEVT